MKLLENKVAIVTGAGSGIGKSIAIKFAQEGAKVVVSDWLEAGAKETVAQIEKEGGKSIFIKANCAQPQDHENLLNETLKNFGKLDIAINNAGIAGASAPVGEYPIEAWDKVISINLSGVFYGMHSQIPAMLKSGGGVIINISSILGNVGFENAPAYTAAKHGVVGLTKTAAIEYSAKNIRINSVGPAFINTPMLDNNLTPEIRKMVAQLHPIGRMGEADEVAELVLWLSSPKASFVTGSYYPIDGGYLAK